MSKREIRSFGKAFNGKTPSKEEQRAYGLPVLKIRDIDENGQFRGAFESFVDQSFYERHASRKLKAGDTIILNAAHNSDYVGSKSAFVSPQLDGVIATGEWLIVRVEEAHPAFVNHFLKSPSGRKSLKNCVKGIHLYPKDVERIEIPLPQLDDQIRIAHLLGKVEGLIAQRKQHLQELDDLLKSVFLEMFGDPVRNEKGWGTKTLPQIVLPGKNSLKRGPFGGALKKEIFVEAGYLVYEQNHALNNDYSFARYFVTEEKYKELIDFKVVPGDVLISCSGVYLGKLSIVPENAQPGIINQALLKVSLDSQKVRHRFFVHVFGSPQFKDKYFPSNRGGAIPNLPPMSAMKEIPFISPPIELQQDFTDLFEKIDRLKAQYEQSLTDLEALYSALSQMAFKGDLDLSRVPLAQIAKDYLSIELDEKKLPVESGLPEAQIANLDLAAMATPGGRKRLLQQSFTAWLQNPVNQGTSSMIEFWRTANMSALDYSDEDAGSLEFSLTDYDALKQWVFDEIAQARISQTLNTKIVPGDQISSGSEIILRKAK